MLGCLYWMSKPGDIMKKSEPTHDFFLLALVIAVIITTAFFLERILWKIDHDCNNCSIKYHYQEPYRQVDPGQH